jgi:tRNA pseudouridine55 synthase
MDGFLLINKPVGMTSHDVVMKIKRKFKIDKIGHTGTLDPFASGLLILCLGKATKLAYMFSNLDKTYEGTIRLGQHYDTYDTTGKIEKSMIPNVTEKMIKEAMLFFIGHYDQVPPMYSAIKIDGQKLYHLARKGEEVEREARTIEIDRFEMTSIYENEAFDFIAHVSKGTYIRSLAVDLAQRIKTYGALSRLKRISVGPYHLNFAKKIDDVELHDVMTLATFFQNTPSITLNDYMIKLVKNGIYLDERQIITHEPFLVQDEHHNVVAYYIVHEGTTYRPVIIF